LFCFWWDWGLNSGLHACTLSREPHVQSTTAPFVS
jgi:hypothetical protein